MKWQRGRHYNSLTITILARNLVELAYPLAESFASALPLGCRYLIGDAGSTDCTKDFLTELARFAPVTVVDIPWRAEKGGQAIGEATQDIIDKVETPFVYNLQACEVLCDDVHKTLASWVRPQPGWLKFRHFYGNMYFNGATGGHGYGEAPRLFRRDVVNLRAGDGCYPLSWEFDERNPQHNHFKFLGTVHRYGWTWENQILKKAVNHHDLYHGDAQSPAQRYESIQWCRRNPNYQNAHPAWVNHLLSERDYDAARSLAHISSLLEPYR